MVFAHYTDYATFAEAFIGFSKLARIHKLNIGIDESVTSMQTVFLNLMTHKSQFKAGMQCIYCSKFDDIKSFEKIFHQYWDERRHSISNKTVYKNQSNIVKKNKATAVMLGHGKNEGKETVKNTSGANAIQALRKVDFSKVSEMDAEALNAISDQLFKDMSLRLKRKYKKGKKGSIQMGETIRRSLHRGGNIIELVKREDKKDRYRLVILLDVSGSMDKYSFYLLRFIFALKHYFRNIEAFAFSTKLIRITDYLDQKNLAESLSIVSRHADHWSSGTQIGSCLQKFNDLYAKRVLNGKTLTVLLSDGLDTGSPRALTQELEKINMRTKKLIWLNPLKGMKGYMPVQKGMQAALPQLDVFQSAHNLDSLLALENILANA